jgi:hypothetical protein
MSTRRSILAAAVVLAVLPAAAHAQAGVCNDASVTELVTEIARRAPRGSGDSGECNVNLYGGGWSSETDLRGRVRRAFGAMQIAGLAFDNADGTVLRDLRTNSQVDASAMFVGPRTMAPKGVYSVNLPGDYTIAFVRDGHGAAAALASVQRASTIGTASVASTEARPEQR